MTVGARVVKIGRSPQLAPGAVATAQDIIVTGKTQGPCDYLIVDLLTQLTATTVLTNGLLCGIDRVEVQIDASGDSTDPNTGNVFYTLFGGRDCAAAYAVTCVTHGMLEAVSRMLFHVDCIQDGTPLGTAAVEIKGVTFRLPLGKGVPVTVSVRIYIAPTARWAAAGWVYTGGFILAELYAHLVDGCADLKIKQTTKIGFGPQAESELIAIPDMPGYWFLGYGADCRVTAGAPYADRLNGGVIAPGTSRDGWCRIANSDGVVFDQASGPMIKEDMFERNGPWCGWATADLWSYRIYGIGLYTRLMASPIEAKALVQTVFPNSGALATDIWRFWWFYSKKGSQIRITNAQQQQTVDYGAAGLTASQDSKK